LTAALDPDAAVSPGLEFGGDRGYVAGAGLHAGRWRVLQRPRR
jgi:hypothetical protein